MCYSNASRIPPGARTGGGSRRFREEQGFGEGVRQGWGWVGRCGRKRGGSDGGVDGTESEALIDYKIQRLNLLLEFSNITLPEDLK